MKNVQEKMQAISAAQNAFATIESIRPGAIPRETKVLLAELKVDLMDIQDAQEDELDNVFTGVTAEEIARAFR